MKHSWLSILIITILLISSQSITSSVSAQPPGGMTTGSGSPTIIGDDTNLNNQVDDEEADFADPSSGGKNNNNSNSNDYDNDGILDNRDQCPTISGRGDKYGGSNSSTGCPVDSDGDDINDNDDKCPWHMGLADNFGCPEWVKDDAVSTEATNETRTLIAYLPFDGDCQIATQDTQRVNVRQYPDSDAEITTAMFPQYGYSVFGAFERDGQVWYMVEGGWVASWVIRSGGDCGDLPQLNDSILPDVTTSNES